MDHNYLFINHVKISKDTQKNSIRVHYHINSSCCAKITNNIALRFCDMGIYSHITVSLPIQKDRSRI